MVGILLVPADVALLGLIGASGTTVPAVRLERRRDHGSLACRIGELAVRGIQRCKDLLRMCNPNANTR
jgi:hypothetical protein